MIAMALIHLHFGGDSSLGYIKKFCYFFAATTPLSSKMIQLDRTTIWNDFSQSISKYMALKIGSLKYFEQRILNADLKLSYLVNLLT